MLRHKVNYLLSVSNIEVQLKNCSPMFIIARVYVSSTNLRVQFELTRAARRDF
jgi:hypothetical protein